EIRQLNSFFVDSARCISQVENDIRGALLQKRIQLSPDLSGFARSQIWNLHVGNIVLQDLGINRGRLSDFTRYVDCIGFRTAALDDGQGPRVCRWGWKVFHAPVQDSFRASLRRQWIQ